jgi:hypothetical protein
MYSQTFVLPVEQRGSSSILGTEHLRSQLPALFEKYNIKSMFDAGANDAAWQVVTLTNIIEYSAGEQNPVMVNIAKSLYPNLDIRVHDITIDALPHVDLLFVRDVAIHLNDQSKRKMIQRWKESSIPWILMTQLSYATENVDFEYSQDHFPFAEINWLLSPWSWPAPTESLTEMPGATRYMSLWHRDQICL